jgi:hypothetical protein
MKALGQYTWLANAGLPNADASKAAPRSNAQSLMTSKSLGLAISYRTAYRKWAMTASRPAIQGDERLKVAVLRNNYVKQPRASTRGAAHRVLASRAPIGN